MKKIILALLVISGNAFSDSTFLGSYDASTPKLSFSELLGKISQHAMKPHSVTLSVGESHLHSKTALKISEEVISEYFKNSNSKIVTCLETLSHFNESKIGKYVFASSLKTKIYEGNSPVKTDFSDCYENKRKNYFTYSGFFHQYPFARPFPEEFPKTPVTEKKDNNILSQMKKSDTMFVTQMELEFLEFTATKSLILNLKKSGDIEEFKKGARKLILNTELILLGMESIVKGENIYESKSAVVLSQDNFDTNLNGENNYFLITNLDYRTSNQSLGLIKSLLNLSSKDLETFKDKLLNSRIFMTTLFQVPDENGNLPNSSYGGPDYTFKGNTYIMHLISERESTLLTFSPGDSKPHCLDYDSIQQVNCF